MPELTDTLICSDWESQITRSPRVDALASFDSKDEMANIAPPDASDIKLLPMAGLVSNGMKKKIDAIVVVKNSVHDEQHVNKKLHPMNLAIFLRIFSPSELSLCVARPHSPVAFKKL
ncbi:hypothetical protein BpHYR1_026267 [Brachionus plicatilis]|uniref:Uncharacterized protein n=1 Tax=Brachionus plicatilis TaxID=10195 RepID=A0A3M7QAC7_BRAPC|nr:hypothetical protein BpHYR1_026267 [Brachionus plicatilis]